MARNNAGVALLPIKPLHLTIPPQGRRSIIEKPGACGGFAGERQTVRRMTGIPNYMLIIRAKIVAIILLAIVSCRGNPLQPSLDDERRRDYIRKQEALDKVPGEANERKQRSLARLRTEGVPFIEHLPAIATVAESKRRRTEEVAERALALAFVAARAEGASKRQIDKLVQDFEAQNFFSPKERAFLGSNPSENDRAQFLWRYEAYWVLLWSLGFVDTLDRPDHTCDVPRSVKIVVDRGRAGFFRDAHLRSQSTQSEILEAADLIYRYHWSVTDARLKNRPTPATLDADVVMERHHALNWLSGYMNQSWDDISTDT